MEFVLTGATANGKELERLGVVNKTFAQHQDVIEEGLRVAEKIASQSGPVEILAKRAVLNGSIALHHACLYQSANFVRSVRKLSC